MEHPAFRKALKEIGFAEVWVAPGFDGYFRFDKGAGERFEAMMKALADESGYSELATVPVVPMGHSASASLPWYFAAWKPDRTLACVSFSGQWPYVPDDKNAPHVAGIPIDGIPGIVTSGEYEWADEHMGRGLKIRAEHPDMPLSALGCPADGHFAVTDEKAEFLALYVKKAAQYRLPVRPGDPLRVIDVKSGWYSERFTSNKSPGIPAARAGDYSGDPAQAFWWFDEEIAKAAEAFQALHRGKPVLVGYVQNGETLPQRKGSHAQVHIKYLPQEDGVTFELGGTFLTTVPEGRPARWAGRQAGESIETPAGGPPIVIQRITGPVKKFSDTTWVLAFNRSSLLGDRRGNEAWLAAIWPGNDEYKRAIQQAVVEIPRRFSEGKAQAITFSAPENVSAGTRALELKATSDSGMPVRYFVREGPAEMDGNTVRFADIPPRAKFPIKVTVVAWQFGRSIEPKVQSAEPVERTFLITK